MISPILWSRVLLFVGSLVVSDVIKDSQTIRGPLVEKKKVFKARKYLKNLM